MSAPRSTMPMRALITVAAALPAYCTATLRSGVVLVKPNSMPPRNPSSFITKKLFGSVAPPVPR